MEPTSTVIPRAEGSGTETAAGNPAASWSALEERLRQGEATSWLSLRTRDGVHTRPVFAAWTGTSFVLASNPSAVKTRHLDAGGRCSLGLDLRDTHLVVEAEARRLVEQDDLERASTAFSEVYDWPTTVESGLLDAPFSAPSSGGPPFRAYELAPVRAHAFPTADQFEPTRFVF